MAAAVPIHATKNVYDNDAWSVVLNAPFCGYDNTMTRVRLLISWPEPGFADAELLFLEADASVLPVSFTAAGASPLSFYVVPTDADRGFTLALQMKRGVGLGPINAHIVGMVF